MPAIRWGQKHKILRSFLFFFKLTFKKIIVHFLRTVTLEIERKIREYIYLKIISIKKRIQKTSKRQKAKQRGQQVLERKILNEQQSSSSALI